MKILEAVGVHLRLRVVATTLEDVRRPFEQRLLPLMNHRRVNAKPARQLGNRLLTLQGIKRNPCFELRLVLLAFRHC
jgi:hypothetical protein